MYVLTFLCLIAVCQFFNKRILLLLLVKPADSIIHKRSNSKRHFHCLAGNSPIMSSTIQSFCLF